MKKLDIVRGELIGLQVVIEDKVGTVIDETKNMLKIKVGDKVKMLIKKNHCFEFIKSGKRFNIDGKVIAFRPEERINITKVK